jgi:hypothetical protein
MIQWFNGDLQPDKLPMDEVTFTGRISDEDLREERPPEYARLVEQGSLARLESEAQLRSLRNFGRVIAARVFGDGFTGRCARGAGTFGPSAARSGGSGCGRRRTW